MNAHAPEEADAATLPRSAGPVLFLRGREDGRLQLAALIARPEDAAAPALQAHGSPATAEVLHRRRGRVVYAWHFSVEAAADAGYWVDDAWFPVADAMAGDLRIAYVSCNGQEEGDRERPGSERNRLWQRLAREHAARPFQLLLHGGDQLYADEMLDVDPRLRAWSEGGYPGTAADADDVRERLRDYLLERYLELYTQAEPAWLMARVPSLCMWDDHDICDGWGSLPAERLDAPLGRAVFGVAREFFLLFQLGAHPDALPPICRDPTGTSLSWSVALPGVSLVAPDLRSERRPDRVLGAAGAAALQAALAESCEGRTFVLSSVPALGPRLSWVEAAMQLTRRMEKYEDDLRDQWQSRAHRDEWRWFLRELLAHHERDGGALTLLSGEIHLATRATMGARGEPLHQLVASGITHPPPPTTYARALGALARLGESPVTGHPIRLHPLPGQRGVYTAQRNYLVLERTGDEWRAWWELEHDGPTPALRLGG